MANRLFSLFDDASKRGRELVASPPRSLEDMVASGSASPGALQAKIDLTSRVSPKVDYSDFGNFVFFNSALDYFNISGERILNEYPYDGTYEDQLRFLSESDGYQAYLVENWPRWSGSARFGSGTAYSGTIPCVATPDTGLVSGSAQTGLLAVGAGSWTCEYHLRVRALPSGASARAIVLQRTISGSNSASLTVCYDQTGSFYLRLRDASGSSFVSPAIALTGAATGARYMAWVLDRASPAVLSWSLYVTEPGAGTDYQQAQRPYVTASGSFAMGALHAGPGGFQVGSGTLTSTLTPVCPEFDLSEVRVWGSARSSDQLYANYNTRVFQSEDLLLYWRLADQASGPQPNSILQARDYSGHRMHGTVTGIAVSGDSFYALAPSGMSPQDAGEMKLSWRDADVQTFVQATQNVATQYDRDNSNLITNLVPYQFLLEEEERNTEVLKNLLYLLGRQFDEIKVAIDQLPKVVLPSTTGFDEAPDALLADALRFWGWEPKGSFLSKEAFQYFFGYNVISGTQASYDNQRLDTELYKIKNEFWHRTLQNLVHVYKRKGTREGAEALLRVYGLDEKIVKLKEFGLQPDVGIRTRRINSDRSATALRVTGTMTVETSGQPLPNSGLYWTDNMQIRFPAGDDVSMSPSLLTGSICHKYQVAAGQAALAQVLAFPLGPTVAAGSSTYAVEELRYTRPVPGTVDPLTGQSIDATGSLTYVVSNGAEVVTSGTWHNVPIFDGRWHSLMIHRSPLTSGTAQVVLHVLHLDEDQVTEVYPATAQSGTVSSSFIIGGYDFSLGRHYMTGTSWNATSGSEFWVRGVQVWHLNQSMDEMRDHALNPFGHGADTPERELSMSLHWELDQEKDAQVAGGCYDSAIKPAGYSQVNGAFYVNDLPATSASYLRDVFDYNFIAPPDMNWNEEKVRVVDGARPPEGERWNESNTVALEFNLVDALNEDISFMMSSMDNWNNVIGDPANRHRESYPTLDRLRRQYFTRLTGRINFRAFADFLDFFDRSFVEMVGRLLPARANYKGAEFVVESHMLERPKVQYTYRRQSPVLVPEGRILMYAPDFTRTAPPVMEEAYVPPPDQTPYTDPVEFYPAAGAYDYPQSIILFCPTPGSIIRYTTDGSTPTTGSSLYVTALQPPTGTITVKAFGFAAGYQASIVTSATYVIQDPTPEPPVITSPADSGTFFVYPVGGGGGPIL